MGGIIIWPCNVSPFLYCKGENQKSRQLSLASCRDIRILIIALLTEDDLLIQKRMLQMQNRHRQREKDTQRYFKT